MIFKHCATALFCLFFFGTTQAKTFSEEEVANELIRAAKEYKLPVKTLLTIVSIESNFEPLVITIETNPRSAKILETLRQQGLRIVSGGYTYHSKQAIVNIYPRDLEMAQAIAMELRRLGFSFDVGLMQINSCNFGIKEAAGLFYPSNNIKKAAWVLRSCVRQFRSMTHRIECYNRGSGNLKKSLRRGKRYYPYWKRYVRHNKKFQ